MNYKAFTLGCITVIIIVLIVIAFIYPNTIYDSSMILLTIISSISWFIIYISTRKLTCVETTIDNKKKIFCEIKGGKGGKDGKSGKKGNRNKPKSNKNTAVNTAPVNVPVNATIVPVTTIAPVNATITPVVTTIAPVAKKTPLQINNDDDDDDDDIDDDVVYYLSQQQSEKVSESYVPSKSYGSDKTNFDKFYNNIVNNNLI